MPEAELARVDECDRSIPRRETIRGTHWQKTPFGCLDLASRNPSWQRSCATATTDRTYDRKRSDSHEQTLATRGPSTYGWQVDRKAARRLSASLRSKPCIGDDQPHIRMNICASLNSTSSRRTPGPITTNVCVARRWSRYLAYNTRLWVPAVRRDDEWAAA